MDVIEYLLKPTFLIRCCWLTLIQPYFLSKLFWLVLFVGASNLTVLRWYNIESRHCVSFIYSFFVRWFIAGIIIPNFNLLLFLYHLIQIIKSLTSLYFTVQRVVSVSIMFFFCIICIFCLFFGESGTSIKL